MEKSKARRGGKAAAWGLVAMTVLFVLLLGRLFALRFEAGDVLPAYSSLRSDPLGARALFDSLDNLPQVTVDRHFQELNKLKEPPPSGAGRTILFLGSPFYSSAFFGKEQIAAYDRLTAEAGRIVIACFPVQKRTLSALRLDDEEDEADDGNKKDGADSKDKKGDDDAILKPPETDSNKNDQKYKADQKEKGGQKADARKDSASELKKYSLEKHWGFSIEMADNDEAMEKATAGPLAPKNWPREMAWHSRLYFDKLDTKWRVLYRIDEMPVMIERRVGRGSAVLVADSYLFSNEAMLKDRHPAMLAWLLSPEAGREMTVTFDEAHLGIQESENIAVLIRKYRLYWPLAALVLLAVLFIWKNAVSLVPPPDSERERRQTIHSSGRDSFSGLISLMRRSVPGNDILKVCYDEWRHTYTLEKEKLNLLDQAAAEVESQPPGGGKQAGLVDKYRTISQILSKGRPWKKARTS